MGARGPGGSPRPADPYAPHVQHAELVEVARSLAVDVAGPASAAVDREARFPHETVDAFRASGLLGALVPNRWGGPGCSAADVSAAVAAIAQHCASSALVLAMHSIQVGAIARHAQPAAADELLPRIANGELLLANANSEEGHGGNRQHSTCALEPVPGGYRLEKRAATVSFAEHADGVTATARRNPDAPASDQVLAICLPPTLGLEATGEWDSLGLRGTCSRPFRLTATLAPEMVIDEYPLTLARTTLPLSSLLLGSVWWGLAEEAARRAHAHLRSGVRRDLVATSVARSETSSSKLLRLSETVARLHELRALLADGAADYAAHEDLSGDPDPGFAVRMNLLKVTTANLAGEVVAGALRLCGLAGYSNRGPSSISRLLRDVSAAALMVDNDRALLASADGLLAGRHL